MLERCAGCGAAFEPVDGPTHDYMESSPACFAAFCELLAAEYSTAELNDVHRLSVDTYAVQHPGRASDRRAVQSTGLHLARLMLQLDRPRAPAVTNAVMLDFSRHKSTLKHLNPPSLFRMTVAGVAPYAGTISHADKVREWAGKAWHDWSAHHDYIRQWITEHSDH